MFINFILITNLKHLIDIKKCVQLNQMVSMKTINCTLKTLIKHRMQVIRSYHQQFHGVHQETNLLLLKLLLKFGHSM